MERSLLSRLVTSDIMRVSSTYQAILEEGRELGRQEANKRIITALAREGFSIEAIARVTELSIEEIRERQRSIALSED
jgi:predicted transposase/invertase (TIGR01784 family)